VQNRVTEEVLLDPVINRTGDVWHVFVEGELHDMLYGYRFDGTFAPFSGQHFDASNVVVDPYAKVVMTRYLYFA
jgi:isoamylase